MAPKVLSIALKGRHKAPLVAPLQGFKMRLFSLISQGVALG
jgi:hypothetical protein